MYYIQKNINKLNTTGSTFFLDPKELMEIKGKLKNNQYTIYYPYKDSEKVILYWDNEYGTGKGIDMEEFTIIVYSNKKKTKYHGKGKYPDNYSRIKELLGELNVR